jgi:hypothetical protein
MPQLTSPAVARAAANVATMAFAVIMLLQLLLAAGVLPVTLAWGGTQSVLTPALRLASLAAVVVLGLMAYVIRRRAALAGGRPAPVWIKVLAWVITLYLALNTLGNFASTSAAERAIFGPLSFILVVACLLVSLSRSDGQVSAVDERL